MPATARSYVVKNAFRSLILSVTQEGKILIHQNGFSQYANRQEAANLLRYARVKNGLIRKLKSLPVG